MIITGGVAAYKSLELIRRLRDQGAAVTPVLTAGAKHFITPLSASALAQQRVYDDLWSLIDEAEMGHIRLARENDLVLVAPATANFMAKMAHGLADDLASTICLATDQPIFVAPAMNPMMWAHAATQANLRTLVSRGVRFIGPAAGDMACGETGFGRFAEVEEIVRAVIAPIKSEQKLTGYHAIVTAGATREPIDPVRYLSNHSSGKQGVAIAAALQDAGAQVTLVHGALQVPVPHGVQAIAANTADDMLAACDAALPADIAVCAAAVSDWRVEPAQHKLKKREGEGTLTLQLQQTPDILAHLSQHPIRRPKLVIGFAAETENLQENAAAKRLRKGCDLLLANHATDTFGAEDNEVWLFSKNAPPEYWPKQSKQQVAQQLVQKIIQLL